MKKGSGGVRGRLDSLEASADLAGVQLSIRTQSRLSNQGCWGKVLETGGGRR